MLNIIFKFSEFVFHDFFASITTKNLYLGQKIEKKYLSIVLNGIFFDAVLLLNHS
jgi:hypothetical protein